jgi:hypothetical protein
VLVAHHEEAGLLGGLLFGLQDRLAPGRDLVPDEVVQLVGISTSSDLDQLRLRREQRGGLDLADQLGQHPTVLFGDLAVDDRVAHQRKLAKCDGGADGSTRSSAGRLCRVTKPCRCRQHHPGVIGVGHLSAAPDLQLADRAGEHALEPGLRD